MISEFQDEHRWLSNFMPCKIFYEGKSFTSVENGYMSAKSHDVEWKEFCSDPNNHPGRVKRKSKKIVLRSDWESIKVSVMKELLIQKFFQSPYRDLLLNTGDMHIQEGNRWGDTFWGVCLKTNTGSNNLGILLMEIRRDLLWEKSLPFYRRWGREWKRFVARWSNLLRHGFTMGFVKKVTIAR